VTTMTEPKTLTIMMTSQRDSYPCYLCSKTSFKPTSGPAGRGSPTGFLLIREESAKTNLRHLVSTLLFQRAPTFPNVHFVEASHDFCRSVSDVFIDCVFSKFVCQLFVLALAII